MSLDIKPATARQALTVKHRHRSKVETMSTTAACRRFESDCAPLDLQASVPGAHRELGPTYLHVTVDRETGCIVDCCVRSTAS